MQQGLVLQCVYGLFLTNGGGIFFVKKSILNNISLKKKLIVIYLLVSIIPIMSLGYFLTNQLYETTIMHDLALSTSSHNQLQDNFLSKFRSYSGVVNGLVSDPGVMKYVDTDYKEDYLAIIDFRTYISPAIRRIQMDNLDTYIRVYSDNTSIAHSEEMSNSLSDLREEPWYPTSKDASTSGLHWVVSDRINDANRSHYFGCYRELKSMTDNTVNRVFAVFYEESQLYSLISEEQESGKIIFLISDKGQIVTSTERQYLFAEEGALEEAFEGTFSSLENDTFCTYLGSEYSVIKTDIKSRELGISGWKLISLIPAGTILDSVQRIWITSIAIALVCITFSLFLVLWVSDNISKRVRGLIKKMNQVVAANYDIEIHSSGADEIGSIEQHFSDMVGKTGELINEVLIANLKIKDSELNYQKLQTEKREAEIIALQEQINPHYLFNTLETIRMNLIIGNDRRNAEIVGLFAESFRIAIDSEREYYSLAEELEFVKMYFKIQEYRFDGSISLIVDVPDELLGIHIPRLFIQPLVENAVYHGIEMKGEPGTIQVSAYMQDSDMCIRVSDDGIGISQEDLNKIMENLNDRKPNESSRPHNRIALRNIHQRLILMFGASYGLAITSELNRGTNVVIRIPVDRQPASE